MKKSLLYLFMLVCSVSLFSSCGDDDDEVKYPIDTDLAGGYIGKLSVVVDGNQMGDHLMAAERRPTCRCGSGLG